MATKVQLRVHRKKKPPTKRTKSEWLHKVAKYLKTDSYLFAPLLDLPPTTTAIRRGSLKPPEIRLPEFGRKAVEYLKSDSYLYGPLLHQSPIQGSCATDLMGQSKMATVEMSTEKMTRRRKDGGSDLLNSSCETMEMEVSEGGNDIVLPLTPERNHVVGRPRGRKAVHRQEMVSHTVRRSRRATPGKGLSGTLEVER